MNDGSIAIYASGGTPGIQYSINGGTNYFSNSSFGSLGVGSYPIAITDTNGCTVTGSTLTISAPGAPSAPTAGTDATYCDGDPVTDLTATGTNIEWFSDAGLTTSLGTGSPFTPTVTVGVTTFYVTQTVSGCQSPSSTVVITVNPLPVIDSVSSTDASACGVNDGTITINASGGTAPLKYSIDGGSNYSNNATFTGLAAGSYAVMVSDTNGCSVTGSTITISSPGAPAAPVAGTDATYCEGDAVADLTATGTNIEWFSDAGLTNSLGTGSPFTPTVAVGVNTFYVTQTVSGCQSSADSVVITVKANPAAPTVTPNGNVLSTGAASSYQWFKGGVLIPGATSQTYTATQTGTYSVTITDANGCSATSPSVDVTVIGINEVNVGISVEIYPNPNSGVFTLEIKVTEVQDMEVTITNVIGQEVLFEKLTQIKGTYQKEIDLKGYAPGVYQLQLKSNNWDLHKRIVIE